MKSYDLKSRHHFAGKGLYSQSYGFSSSHIRIRVLDHKEGCTPKKWCFQIVVLEKTLESPLTWKEIKPVNPQGNQSWIFIGRTDAEAEALILWPLDIKTQLLRKDLDAGKERLKTIGVEGGRGWDGWIASLTEWTLIWANSGRWRRTGKPGVLQSMGSQRVGHDLETEKQQLL